MATEPDLRQALRADAAPAVASGHHATYMSYLFTSNPARLVLLPALAQRRARGGVGRHHFQHAFEARPSARRRAG